MDLHAFAKDPALFRSAIWIDCDGQRRRFAEVVEPWQRADFEALDPGWRRCVGQPGAEALMRAAMFRPRGHSKSTDLAVQVCWALVTSKRPLRGICAASDSDQAAILKRQVEMLCRANPWLGGALDVQACRVINRHTGSTLQLITSDAPSSFGEIADFICLDELTCWQKRELYDSLLSTASKRANCLLVVISNAGFLDTWQAEVVAAIQADPSWYYSSLDGPQATWMQGRLEELRRHLPPVSYDRLVLNKWASGKGDALSESDIAAAVTLAGPMSAAPGWSSVCGVDLGIVRDFSAAVELWVHTGTYSEVETPRRLTSTQRAMIDCGLLDDVEETETEVHYEPSSGELRLGRVRVWKPSERRVDLDEIEATILSWHPSLVALDLWQAESLNQHLQKAGVLTWPVTFAATNLQEMATATLGAFQDRKLSLWAQADLLRDLRSMKIIDRAAGFRLQWDRDTQHGHGDCGQALLLSVLGSRRVEAAGSNAILGDLIFG